MVVGHLDNEYQELPAADINTSHKNIHDTLTLTVSSSSSCTKRLFPLKVLITWAGIHTSSLSRSQTRAPYDNDTKPTLYCGRG